MARKACKSRSGEESCAWVRDGETRLRLALDSAEMVTWEWDVLTDSVRYSENLPSIVKGKAIDKYEALDTIMKTLHPEDRAKLASALERTRKKGIPFECEYRVMMLDGTYHWILGKGKTVIRRQGKPIRVLGISQDVTARKQAELELQARTHQLAQLAAELTLAEHKERRRIADRLHEELQQVLFGARVQAHSLAQSAQNRNKAGAKRLCQTLDSAVALTRSITRTLAPPASLQKDLAFALQWLAQEMQEQCRISIAVRVDRSVHTLPEPCGVLIFTAAREFLLNIAKHSGVRRGTLRLWRSGGLIHLEVRDRGKGMGGRPARTAAIIGGFGLFSIRERAELLGGKLVVESGAGTGTRAQLSLPIQSGASAGSGESP